MAIEDLVKGKLLAQLAQDKAAYFAAGGKVTVLPSQAYADAKNKKNHLTFGELRNKELQKKNI
tara:strand:- start:5598 stop:5786 length:189 start_codon:yes stop_codon:yes gene_type:complete